MSKKTSFEQNANEITGPRSGRPPEPQSLAPEDELNRWLLMLLEDCPAIQPLARQVFKAGFRCIPVDDPGFEGLTNVEKKWIAISMTQARPFMLSTLAHELKHAAQFLAGATPYWNKLPKEQVASLMMLEADAESYGVWCCLQMAMSGNEWAQKEMKRGLLTSGQRSQLLYAEGLREARKDRDASYKPELLAHLYDCWFVSRNCYSYKESFVKQAVEWQPKSLELARRGEIQPVSQAWMRGFARRPVGAPAYLGKRTYKELKAQALSKLDEVMELYPLQRAVREVCASRKTRPNPSVSPSSKPAKPA